MLDDFLVRAGLAGLGLALAAGPLGCFVVWRRMAFFGDATAHAGILGVALSLAFSISIFLGVLGVALLMALLLSVLVARGHVMDTTLGVLSHGALALGLVAVSFLPTVRVDLASFLFGDVLAVSKTDLAVIWAGAVLVMVLMYWRWSSMLTATLNPDLAMAGGIDPKREQFVLTVAMAVIVAVAIKVVGALLIAALLIIPAAAARPLVRTPEWMALVATLIGGLATLAGLGLSFKVDTPTGPSMVVAALAVFTLSTLLGRQGRDS
ncbi:MAG: metal ABC transporter permease [Pseudomonadota bacterium]